jgi:alpha-L-fucosidase
MTIRHRKQLKELLTNYGKVDMVCLDQWPGKDICLEIKATIKD